MLELAGPDKVELNRAATYTPGALIGGSQGASMAENKRQSMAGKIATPNLKVGSAASRDVVDADSNLHKAVGSR